MSSLLLLFPSSSSATELTPSTGAVVVSGAQPALRKVLSPSVGAVSLTGKTPSLSKVLTPSSGSIFISGQAANISFALLPAFGAVSVSGNEPLVAVGTILSPTSGGVEILGSFPSIDLIGGREEFYSGGWGRTEEDVRKSRIKLGILPPDKQEQAEDAVDDSLRATAKFSTAKPETQEATDALQEQRRAYELYAQVYLSVYPALEESSIREALVKAQKAAMEEEAFAIALMML